MKTVACKVAFSLKLLRSRVTNVRNLPGRLESAILFTQCFVYLRFTSVTVRRVVCSMKFKSSLLIQSRNILSLYVSSQHEVSSLYRSYLLTYACCALATCSSNCLYNYSKCNTMATPILQCICTTPVLYMRTGYVLYEHLFLFSSVSKNGKAPSCSLMLLVIGLPRLWNSLPVIDLDESLLS